MWWAISTYEIGCAGTYGDKVYISGSLTGDEGVMEHKDGRLIRLKEGEKM